MIHLSNGRCVWWDNAKKQFQTDLGWQGSHLSCFYWFKILSFQFRSYTNSLETLDWNKLINWSLLTFSISSICSSGSSVNTSAMGRFPARAEQPHRPDRCRTRAKLRSSWMWVTLGCLFLPALPLGPASLSPTTDSKHQLRGDTSIPCHVRGKQHGLWNCFDGISEVPQGFWEAQWNLF